MKNLEDLRKRKETLRKEIAELEDIAAFKNPKESLDKVVSSVKERYEKYKHTAANKASGIVKEVETELDALK